MGIIVIIIIIIIIVIIWNSSSTGTESKKSSRTEDTFDYELYQKQKQEERRVKAAREQEELNGFLQQYNDCLRLDINVVGIYYRSNRAKEEIPDLDIKDEIKLRKESTNRHDPFAVKVIYDRIHLGYVPSAQAKLVTDLIDNKRIKKVLVKSAGSGKVYSWDEPDPYLNLTVLYEK